VRDGNPPQTNIVHVDGNRSVLMMVLKAGSTSTLDIIAGIKQKVIDVKDSLPDALKVGFIGDQSVFVRGAITGVAYEGIIAALLTSVMILLFLGSWRSTVIIAVSIPLSVLGAIVHVVCQDLRAKGCAVQLLDAQAKLTGTREAFGLSDAFLARFFATFDEDLGRAQALAGGCVPILEVQRDPGVPYRDAAAREKVGSVLHVPLGLAEHVVGVASVFTYRPYEFSEDELFLMATIGEQCALAVRNAQAYGELRREYQGLVDDFQKWFGESQTYPRP